MSSPSPPPVAQTVQQSQQANKDTAVAQAGLNSTNQITPQGNLTYNQIGTWSDGTPRFEATTQLSPEQQGIYNQQTANQAQLGQIGGEQLSRIGGILGTPFDLNSAINTQQSDIARTLLDPVWNQRSGALDTKLANQGIGTGSEAYTNALRDFGMQRDNSYNQALLSGRAQATQEALANRNQPLNEISALMSGSQVSMPNFAQTPQTQIANTDVAGLVNNNYNAQLAQSNAKVGGLFGLVGAAASPFSYAAGKKFFS